LIRCRKGREASPHDEKEKKGEALPDVRRGRKGKKLPREKKAAVLARDLRNEGGTNVQEEGRRIRGGIA